MMKKDEGNETKDKETRDYTIDKSVRKLRKYTREESRGERREKEDKRYLETETR